MFVVGRRRRAAAPLGQATPLGSAGHLARLDQEDPARLDLAAIDRGIEDVARREANLRRAIEDEDDDEARAELRLRWKELRAQHEQLQAERGAVLQRREAHLQVKSRILDVQAWLAELRGAVQDMPYEMRRKALRALNVRVVVYPESHQPRWEITAEVPVECIGPIGNTPY